jgi:hypothetical protein
VEEQVYGDDGAFFADDTDKQVELADDALRMLVPPRRAAATRGDGNCLIYAVLVPKPIRDRWSHKTLREAGALFLSKNFEMFEESYDQGRASSPASWNMAATFSKHVERMGKVGEFVDYRFIIALASVLYKRIHVFCASLANPIWETFHPQVCDMFGPHDDLGDIHICSTDHGRGSEHFWGAILVGTCCCGCGDVAAGSKHKCGRSDDPVMAWCQTGAEGYGSSEMCVRCDSYGY